MRAATFLLSYVIHFTICVDWRSEHLASAQSVPARVQGAGLSSAAVGRPSTFTLTLLESFGGDVMTGGKDQHLGTHKQTQQI